MINLILHTVSTALAITLSSISCGLLSSSCWSLSPSPSCHGIPLLGWDFGEGTCMYMLYMCLRSVYFDVQELVLEKESRIRETMLMMGLKQWTLWSTWYLKQFIFFMVSVVMICILVKVRVE